MKPARTSTLAGFSSIETQTTTTPVDRPPRDAPAQSPATPLPTRHKRGQIDQLRSAAPIKPLPPTHHPRPSLATHPHRRAGPHSSVLSHPLTPQPSAHRALYFAREGTRPSKGWGQTAIEHSQQYGSLHNHDRCPSRNTSRNASRNAWPILALIQLILIQLILMSLLQLPESELRIARRALR
jgi:hypothetical protein